MGLGCNFLQRRSYGISYYNVHVSVMFKKGSPSPCIYGFVLKVCEYGEVLEQTFVKIDVPTLQHLLEVKFVGTWCKIMVGGRCD